MSRKFHLDYTNSECPKLLNENLKIWERCKLPKAFAFVCVQILEKGTIRFERIQMAIRTCSSSWRDFVILIFLCCDKDVATLFSSLSFLALITFVPHIIIVTISFSVMWLNC